MAQNTQNWLKYKQMGEGAGEALAGAKSSMASASKYNKAGIITSSIANMLKDVGDIVNNYEYRKTADKLSQTNPFMEDKDGNMQLNPDYKDLMMKAANYSGNGKAGYQQLASLEMQLQMQQMKAKQDRDKIAMQSEEQKRKEQLAAEQRKEEMALARDKAVPSTADLLKRGVDISETPKTGYVKVNTKEGERYVKVDNESYNPTNVPPAQRAYDYYGGKSFQSKEEKLPDVAMRTAELGEAIKIADKVFTDPITGDAGVFIQSAMGKDKEYAQRLRYFLQKETVREIMKFAEKAGVRAIDTEREQQRLFRAIANPRMSKEVLKDVLGSMQHYANEYARRVEEEKAYRESRPDFSLRGFKFEPRLYTWSTSESTKISPKVQSMESLIKVGGGTK